MTIDESIRGFRFTPTGIAGVLKQHRLLVPLYQREYAWTVEQVTTLYNDYSRAKVENTDYFLGTIVTIRGGNGDPLEIVDGQQRLTTTSLLIAAIRDHLASIGEPSEVIESINNDFLSSFDRRQGSRISQLVLNIDDREFYNELLSGNSPAPTRESHERLLKARKQANAHVQNLIRAYAEKDRSGILNDWLDFLEHNATIILVEAQNGAQAFKMFETLNDRGLKTSQADLVKSYLFGQSGSRITESQSRWSSMKDNLEEIDDEDRAINFLRHAIIATRQFVRSESVYEYTQTIRGESNSSAFLAELERLSRIYVATYSNTSAHWSGYPVKATRALSVFNKFDIKPLRPLVLSLATSFEKSEFADAMALLVSISVRLLIAGNSRSGTIETATANTAIKIYSQEVTDANQLQASLKTIIVSDADFKEGFLTARASRADLARYYLQTLEAANADESEPWYVANDDPSVMTLEHVLSVNGDMSNWPDFDDETKRRMVKRLGNLCILNKSANNNLGDVGFSAKQHVYRSAPFELTRMIADESTWDAQSIERRQARLADLAVKAWPV